MPLHAIINPNPKTQVLVWKITETFNDLFDQVALTDSSLVRLNNMKSLRHQLGYLSVRLLLQQIKLNDYDLHYSPNGKPSLKILESPYISITHSGEFSAIIVSNQPVGIDIELIKPKVLQIAPRFMNVLHLENLTDLEKIKKATIVWGIKECVFKIKNEKGISFPNHIFESQFEPSQNQAKAQLQFNNQTENFQMFFEEIENYMLVYAFNL